MMIDDDVCDDGGSHRVPRAYGTDKRPEIDSNYPFPKFQIPFPEIPSDLSRNSTPKRSSPL
jgi:hypothetical protein